MMNRTDRNRGLLFIVFALAASVTFLIPNAGLAAGETEQQAPSAQMEEGTDVVQGGEQELEVEDPSVRIDLAAKTLQNMMDRQGERIPPEIIQNAEAVAIFPEVTKAAALIGGRYGTGVLMIKQEDQWNGPLFLSLYGASVGAQLGAESTDLVMVFTERDSLEDLQDGALEFGTDASVAAGPWGEKAKASTQAEILAYKETEGLFAGLSLSSGYIEVNDPANRTFFQEGDQQAYYPSAEEMIAGKQAPEKEKTNQLKEILNQYAQQAGEAGAPAVE